MIDRPTFTCRLISEITKVGGEVFKRERSYSTSFGSEMIIRDKQDGQLYRVAFRPLYTDDISQFNVVGER